MHSDHCVLHVPQLLDILLRSSTKMRVRSFIEQECKLEEVIGRYANRYVNRIIEFIVVKMQSLVTL